MLLLFLPFPGIASLVVWVCINEVIHDFVGLGLNQMLSCSSSCFVVSFQNKSGYNSLLPLIFKPMDEIMKWVSSCLLGV